MGCDGLMGRPPGGQHADFHTVYAELTSAEHTQPLDDNYNPVIEQHIRR